MDMAETVPAAAFVRNFGRSNYRPLEHHGTHLRTALSREAFRGALRRPLPVPLASMLVGKIHACGESHDGPDNQDSDHAFDDELCRAASAHNFHSFLSGFPLLPDFPIAHFQLLSSGLFCHARGT